MSTSARAHLWPLSVAAPRPVPPVRFPPPPRAAALVAPVAPVEPQPKPVQRRTWLNPLPRQVPEVDRLSTLPLELVYLLLSFLDPPSLLALTCSSRSWANLLRRSSSTHTHERTKRVWAQARLNARVPELESDLGGGGEAREVAHEVLLARLLGGWACQFEYLYFVPDALAVSAHLYFLEAEAVARGARAVEIVDEYARRRMALRVKVRRDAEKLKAWRKVRDDDREDEMWYRLGSRHGSVFEKLDDLGFDSWHYDGLFDDFFDYAIRALAPSSETSSQAEERGRLNDDLDRFLGSSDPLTDREWRDWKPLVVAWVCEHRRYCQQAARDWASGRLERLHPLVERCVGVDKEWFVPPVRSFLRLPSLEAMWADGEQFPESYEVDAALPAAIADAVHAMRDDRLTLLDRISRALLAEGDPLPPSILLALSSSPSPFIDRDARVGVEPGYLAISPADIDAVLGRATALFRCGICGLVAPAAQLVPHVHASQGSRAPPRCIVAPAPVRALLRGAVGPTASVGECEARGRVWEVEGRTVEVGEDGASMERSWTEKGLTWAEVMQHGLSNISTLNIGPVLAARSSTIITSARSRPWPPSPECGDRADELWDVDFDVRVRLCVECWPRLVRSKKRILEDLPDLHPRALDCSPYTTDLGWPDAVDEDDYKYFVPDVLEMSKALHELQCFGPLRASGSSAMVEYYYLDRKLFSSQAHRDGVKLASWWRGEKADRELEIADEEEYEALERRGSIRRQHAIFHELEKLGCPEPEINGFFESYVFRYHAFAPSLSSGRSEGSTARNERGEYNVEIDRFCEDTEPLADYEWYEYQVRVRRWVVERRKYYADAEARAHREAQQQVVSPLHDLVARCLGPEAGPLLCPLDVFLKFPAVRSLWAPAGADVRHHHLVAVLPHAILRAVEVMREDRLILFNRVARTLLAEGDPLPSSVQHALSTAPSPFIDYDPRHGIEPAYRAIPPADLDLVLNRATALFRCGRCGLVAYIGRLLKHLYAATTNRAASWCHVAPAEARALVRGAAGASTSFADCDAVGPRWQVSGSDADGVWAVRALEWGDVIHTKLDGVEGLVLGAEQPHPTGHGRGSDKVLGMLLVGQIAPVFAGPSSALPAPLTTSIIMFDFFGNDSDQAQAAQAVQNQHKSSLTHELIAGAAAFEAQRAYARHCEQNGKPESHQKARELFAAFAAAEADKLIETKGLDFMDREEVKRQARQHADALQPDSY
ncbi:hypothetical protein JCM3775_002179 [Rhodotorula graminis]